MSLPLVSICIPTYNGALFLKQALDSILAQTYTHFEVVCSDDQSTDGTWELLEQFKATVTFPVSLLRHTPSGIGANWNHCVKHANGEYIKFLFQDDLLHPNCLEKMVSVLQTHPQVAMVASQREILIEDMDTDAVNNWFKYCGNLQVELENEMLLYDASFFKDALFTADPTNKIGEPTAVMYRKSFVQDVGEFNERYKQILDYEYWYRILKKHTIAILPEKLVSFRLHPAQATQVNLKDDLDEYEVFTRVLYDEYFHLLSKKHRKNLLNRYNPYYKSRIFLSHHLRRTYRRVRKRILMILGYGVEKKVNY